MMPLVNLKEDEYNKLKETGMLYELYPIATGDYDNDVTIPYKKMIDEMFARGKYIHQYKHKFDKWLRNTFGKDLHGEIDKLKFKVNGKTKTIKTRSYNERELNDRLSGYEVIERIEKYIKRSCPEIKIVHCDDDVHAGSILLLIPHPTFGITVMFIPQCTTIQNTFFLYGNHYKQLLSELGKMENIYSKEDLDD